MQSHLPSLRSGKKKKGTHGRFRCKARNGFKSEGEIKFILPIDIVGKYGYDYTNLNGRQIRDHMTGRLFWPTREGREHHGAFF